jgi:hypothetical protein
VADTSGNAVAAAKAVIAGQLKAGHIEPGAASALDNRLDDLARLQSRGQAKQVASRIESLKSLLMSMLRSGRVTDAGYQAILASIGELGQPR